MNIPRNKKRNKRAFIIITAITLGILTLFATIQKNMDIKLNTKNYVALGDSISSGYGLESIENAFPNLLATSLDRQEHFYNFAVDGHTSQDLLNRLSEDEVIEKIKNSELITITTGGNDIIQLFQTFKDLLNVELVISVQDIKEVLNNPVVLLSLAAAMKDVDLQTPFADMVGKFEQNLLSIINKIKAINPETRIIVQTVYNPILGIEEYRVIEPLVDTLIKAVNEIIIKLEPDNYEIVDTYQAFREKSAEYTNINDMDIHPSIAGHKLIYDMVYEKVKMNE